MASRDERLSVRFSPAELAHVQRAARTAGVADAALVRECALRWGAVLAANIVAEGEIVLRRRTGVRAVTPQGPPS